MCSVIAEISGMLFIPNIHCGFHKSLQQSLSTSLNVQKYFYSSNFNDPVMQHCCLREHGLKFQKFDPRGRQFCPTRSFFTKSVNRRNVYLSSSIFWTAISLVIFCQLPSILKSRILLKTFDQFRASFP